MAALLILKILIIFVLLDDLKGNSRKTRRKSSKRSKYGLVNKKYRR